MGEAIFYKNKVYVSAYAAVGGKKESEGPLSSAFDYISDDDTFSQATWEKSESAMQQKTVEIALNKSKKSPANIDYILAGDLLNQCIGSNYGLRDFNIKMIGLYGACSTMAESIAMGAVMVSSGYAQNVIALTSSHFCSAERQFRYPLEYGGQRCPTAQWTATASGAVVLSNECSDIYVEACQFGKIVDMGICDITNMGAAMAPAAVETLSGFFKASATSEKDYDLILTGDLGKVGKDIVLDLMGRKGYDLSQNYNDCGTIIYDLENQDVHAGGSGCGCSAGVLCARILPFMQKGEIKSCILVGTGALMSPTSVYQGESIPAIAHLVVLRREQA